MYIKLTRVKENIVINNETLETILRPISKKAGKQNIILLLTPRSQPGPKGQILEQVSS